MLGLNYAHIESNREIPLYVAGARILHYVILLPKRS